MRICLECGSASLKKKGKMKSKRGVAQRFQCKECKKTFTKRTDSLNYRHRKQNLRNKITELYCEGMSLRAIGRVLKINRKTVNKYFIENSNVARVNNLKKIEQGGIMTTYVQFDELETFEHTRRKPIGIQCSIRVKTGEIISTKICTVPLKALTVSKRYIMDWNIKVHRDTALTDMFLETKKTLKENYVVSCDMANRPVMLAKKFFSPENIQSYKSSLEGKKIDYTFMKMRQDISRLRRKTLATTKKKEFLQKHLDLYTDYHNTKRVA